MTRDRDGRRWRFETEHEGVLDRVPEVWERAPLYGWGAMRRARQGVALGLHSARDAALWALELPRTSVPYRIAIEDEDP